MPGLSFPCVCCHSPNAEDEYHWWLDDGQEIVWKLCDRCCEFAVEMVECISNLEDELERWIKNGT